jgi:superfamily II DNA or RNA helicase
MSPKPEVGQLVQVRKRAFVVTEVLAQGLPGGAVTTDHPNHLVSLSSVEDDSLGEELEIVWELEPGAVAHERSTLPEPAGFDNPRVLDAFLDAVCWGAVSQADDKALQSPFRSGIDPDEYQLDPVVRALTMPRVNLLIADDVGLGKTIEAGLAVQELILRHRVRTVLVACPSSLQIQWKEEMRDKFGLEFRIIDSEAISQLRRKRGIHINPWGHFPRLITSIDFLKRERPLRLFRDTLPAGDQPTYPRRYDLLIVDESHNVAPPGRGNYATDSMRTQAIRMLAPHFEHKLFLSATPHNGYRESFAALLELLDNQRFARALMPDRTQLETVMVRRMKSELELRWDGTRRFAERKVYPLEVAYTETERRAHRALQQYTALRLKTSQTEPERFAAEFVLKLLKKRLFSSPAAFAITLEKHRRSIAGAHSTYVGTTAWRRQIENADDDFANDEEYESSAQDAVEAAGGALSSLGSEETSLLRELGEYAKTAASRPDSKAQSLVRWLETHICPSGVWGDERVIIFTEYRATQKWLYDLLATQGFVGESRLQMLYGGMPSDDRERIKAAFQARPAESPVRILLATDAASEGINLQNHCSKLIHYEIPWNPNRMEQRNGRVDRHGQKAAEVHVFHFVGKGFDAARVTTSVGDLEADLEFLMRAALKVQTIREDLGKVGPVIASQVEEAMLGKRNRLQTEAAEKEAEPVRRMLKFERELRKQLEKLAAQLHETKQELRLSPENIENVVKVALSLAGQPALIETTVPGLWPDPDGLRKSCPVFTLPALSGSWALCAEGLAHPHTHKIRPIVFDPTLAAGRDDVVLAHLNHRLVQMCLRLLRAEIWSMGGSKRIHRVCSRVVPDSALQGPAVIAHGRIVVLGGDNHRIHEEVIMAGALMKEGRLVRMNVGETKAAYDAATGRQAPGFVEDRLTELWPKHRDQLLAALEARMAERTKNLEKFLEDRAAAEVEKLTAILQELDRVIRKELAELVPAQITFAWSPEEKAQRDRDHNALRRRLDEIPGEIERESEHLRSRFRNPSARLFPVAITYLVPQRAIAELRGGHR